MPSILPYLIALVVFSSSACVPQFASAESSAEEHVADADSPLAQAQWKRTRARVGLGFSMIAIPAGVVMLSWGIISKSSPSEGDISGSGRWQRFDRAMITTGSLFMAGGLVGIALSGRGLRRAKRDVDSLERRVPPTTLHLSSSSVRLVHRF